MSGTLIYVIGYPGCGKTTAMALALGNEVVEVRDKPFKHTLYRDGIVELGYRKPPFSGTDTLSLAVQPKVVEWLADVSDRHRHVIVGEGDRLANRKFFKGVQALGWKLEIVYISVPALVARNRAWKRGSRQDDAWYKGRISKVRNLVNDCIKANTGFWVSGNQEPEAVAGQLRAVIDDAKERQASQRASTEE